MSRELNNKKKKKYEDSVTGGRLSSYCVLFSRIQRFSLF